MIFLMIIMIILHMDGNVMLLIEMLSFLLMIFIILFHFRDVIPESDVYSSMLY